MDREDEGSRRDADERRAHLYARGLAVGLAAMSFVVAGCSSGNDAAPRGSPVPGTSAFVNDQTVSPLHVGQYIGRLKKVEGGCQGRAGTSSSRGWDVGLRIDKNCRVFVLSITTSGGQEGPRPSGGTFVPATPAKSDRVLEDR